jgi:hypothetical protein
LEGPRVVGVDMAGMDPEGAGFGRRGGHLKSPLSNNHSARCVI